MRIISIFLMHEYWLTFYLLITPLMHDDDSQNVLEHIEESEESTCSSFTSDMSHPSNDQLDEVGRKKTPKEKVIHLARRTFFSIFYLKYAYSTIAMIVLVILGVVFWKVEIQVIVKSFSNKTEDKTILKEAHVLCFTGALILLAYILLSIILRGIIRIIIHTKDKFNSYMYVAGQMAEATSIGIIAISILIITILKKENYELHYAELSFRLDLFDVIFVVIVGNFLIGVVTGLVEFISFKFNRVTFVERIYFLFRLNYLIKLLKVIKIFRNRSTRESNLWEYAFHWVPLSKNLSYERIKRPPAADIILPEDKNLMDKGDYIFKEFQKSIESLIYRKSMHTQHLEIDIEEKVDSLYRLIRHQEINTMGDFSKYFDSEKRFNTLLFNLQIHKDTAAKKYFVRHLLNKQIIEKKNISRSLKQINSALMRIQFALYSIIVAFMTIYIILSSYKKETLALNLISAFFGTGFAFQSSVKNTLDSIIFLFCIHPFDVGDRVFIPLDGETENLVVSEMNVFSTAFIKFNGSILYISNAVLASKTITNVRRSGMMLEAHVLAVNADTELGKLGMFKMGITKWIRANQRNFGPLVMVNIESIETSVRLNLKFLVQYKRNWHDYIAYLYIKDKLFKEITRLLKVCRIEYMLPMQPIDVVKRKIYKKKPEL